MVFNQGHDAAMDNTILYYTGPGTTWANEMNFGMNHAPGAGLIARPVDLQSSVLPLCHDCPHKVTCIELITPIIKS